MGLILSRASGVCLPVAGFRARCQQSGSTDAQINRIPTGRVYI